MLAPGPHIDGIRDHSRARHPADPLRGRHVSEESVLAGLVFQDHLGCGLVQERLGLPLPVQDADNCLTEGGGQLVGLGTRIGRDLILLSPP